MKTIRELALRVAERLLFTPYLWGGDDPLAGFDCSGFVIEVLKSTGVLPRQGDWTAEDLRQRFVAKQSHMLVPGSLIFWRTEGQPGARHVEMVYAVIGGEAFTIGASGGGSKTSSLAAAVEQDAYIKIRPATPGWFDAVDPFS
jgi:hypothetical protein